ncbi:MAG: hypothetical protein GX616_13475 [Planctomycetes bacterium]|nr:hypothetical protein [Planctomycetota bacterium]
MSSDLDRQVEQLLDQAGADAQPRRPSWDEMRDRIAATPQIGARRLVLPRRLVAVVGVAAMIAIIVGVLFHLPISPIAQAGNPPIRVIQKDIELTVFNQFESDRPTLFMPTSPPVGQPVKMGMALVKDHRIVMNLQTGDNVVYFTDVAATIDPTSVRFSSETDPIGTKVVEQNFEYDLATAGAILKRYLDRKITCVLKDGKQYEGFLCSHDGDIVLADKPPSDSGQMRQTESISRDQIRAVQMPDVPKDLFVKPTLVWKIRTKSPGQHETTLMYACGHADWQADYVVAVTPGGRGEKDQLDLQGWVTIDNRTGSTYKDAGIKLIAGDVNRVPDPWAIVQVESVSGDMPWSMTGDGIPFVLFGKPFNEKEFVEKSFFENHLYTLSAPSTVKDQQIKQLKLLKAEGAKALRRYVFDSPPGPDERLRHVSVVLEFKNEKDNKLGMPLPKGRVRVMQRDPDGDMQLINTTEIDHTAKDEEMKLTIGTAFDVAAERSEMNMVRPGHQQETRTIRLRMRNHRDEPIEARFVERMVPNRNWEITLTSDPWTREDVSTIHFDFTLEPDAEKEITYTVDYQW